MEASCRELTPRRRTPRDASPAGWRSQSRPWRGQRSARRIDMDRPRTIEANVLVIGSGAAGTRAAIAAHEAGVEVVVVGKRPRGDAHTVLASGGINGALGTRDPMDSWEQHYADTLREGYFLGHPHV